MTVLHDRLAQNNTPLARAPLNLRCVSSPATVAAMTSRALQVWLGRRASELDEFESLLRQPGRRLGVERMTHAYATDVSAQFQGFSRDLHGEASARIAAAASAPLQPVIQVALTRDRALDRGNPHSGALAADFGRLGIKLWDELYARDPGNRRRSRLLDDEMNRWRNAIAHQDFDRHGLGGVRLRVPSVRRWRAACGVLARHMDRIVADTLTPLVGRRPW